MFTRYSTQPNFVARQNVKSSDSARYNWLGRFSALRYTNFRWFWLNGAAQAMAQGMQFLILGWLVLEITRSAYQMGLIIFAFGMPNLLFALVGGIIADRSSRLKLLINTRLCVAGLIFLLAILEIAGFLELWHVYGVVLLLGTIQALNGSARMAIVGDLVDRDDIMNAVTLHQMVNQTGQILGPALAGGIIELIGIGSALTINAGLYLASVIFLWLIKGLAPSSNPGDSSISQDLRDGFNCIRLTPIVYTVIAMTIIFAFFTVSYRNIMPAFAQEVLNTGAAGSGLLLLGAGLGSLAGSLILASFGNFRNKSRLMVTSVLLLSLFLTAFAWSPWFWASWVILLFVGTMSFGFFTPLANTLIQLNVAPELRGRVLSVFQLAPAVHYLGALPLAATADIISWPVAITGGASISFILCFWLGVWRPILRRSDN